jgi:hypothetical protein
MADPATGGLTPDRLERFDVRIDDTEARENDVRSLVQEAFATAKRHLGTPRARAIFKEVSAGRAGAPRGVRDLKRALELLLLYDAEARHCRTPRELQALPRKIAQRHRRPGTSVDTLARHIRDLLGKRKKATKEEHAFVEGLRRTRMNKSHS